MTPEIEYSFQLQDVKTGERPMVVGPEGEEIYTDEHVPERFREGPFAA